MAKRVSLSLDNAQIEAMRVAFGDRAARDLPDAKLEAVAKLAFQAWYDCFCGGKKYRSLTEQHLEWLAAVYREILTDEEPSEQRLHLGFQFSYGQAQYLSRVLRQQGFTAWRTRALKALESALASRAAEAKGWVGEGRGEERMIFSVPKSCRVELDAIYGTVLDGGASNLRPFRSEGSMGNYFALSICAADLNTLLKQTTKTLGSLP